jgi:hypothetical protein
MRGTVFASLLFLGASGYYIASHHLFKDGQFSHSSSKTKLSSSSRKRLALRKKSKPSQQGEQHESTSHRSRQQVEPDIESVGSEEGDSSSFDQAENLPSIYQDEELESSGFAVNLGEDEVKSESNESSSQPQKQPVVYGVPVASWLKHSKNQLPAKVEITNDTGMRLFINCMEIKKHGTSALTQRECKEIAVSREKSKGAALIQ